MLQYASEQLSSETEPDWNIVKVREVFWLAAKFHIKTMAKFHINKAVGLKSFRWSVLFLDWAQKRVIQDKRPDWEQYYLLFAYRFSNSLA